MGWRANQNPTTTPPSEPIANARIDSHSVIARCFQITPLRNQSKIWLPTSTGLEKKNGGSSMRPKIGTVANNFHSPSATTATSNRNERTPILHTLKLLSSSLYSASAGPQRSGFENVPIQPVAPFALPFSPLNSSSRVKPG